MNDLPNAAEIYLRYISEYDDRDLEALLSAYRDGLYLFLLSYVKNLYGAASGADNLSGTG